METHKEDCLEDEDQLDDSELGFEEMGLDPRLLRAISKKGLSKPTPIQLKAIPLILEGKDVVARAKTGSGKTLAYLLPLLQKNFSVSCQSATASGPRALILVPTRELCQQVYAEAKSLLEYCGGTWKAVQLTSSMSVSSLRAALAGPPDIVVTTPACCAKCLSEEIIRVPSLKESLSTLVLDEADLLLSYGYEEDIRNFARHIPRRCQCLLMSATLSADVEKLKKLVLHNPVTLTLKDLDGNVENKIVPETVQQFWISCKAEDKLLNLLALLHLELVQTKALVFVNTIDSGFRVKLFLEQFGVKSAVLNAELPQNSRLHILQEFNIGLFDYLIATDDGTSVNENDLHTEKAVKDKGIGGTKGRCLKWNGKKMPIDSEFGVTRGIDFKNVRTVINFDMPGTPANYVHRIGRTGRAQCTGASISLVSLEEEKLLKDVEELLCGGNVVESGPQKAITPFPSITNESIESLRYRGEDVARGVTKAAVREARAKELRMEILNSERLKAHFEDHPKDLEILKHDKVLSKKRPLPHLRTVPEYLRDPTTEAASRAVKLARAAMGHAISGFKSRQRKKRFRTDDPLKIFSVKSKKRKEKSGEPNSTLWARKKGERKRSSSSGKHVQHQRKHRRHK